MYAPDDRLRLSNPRSHWTIDINNGWQVTDVAKWSKPYVPPERPTARATIKTAAGSVHMATYGVDRFYENPRFRDGKMLGSKTSRDVYGDNIRCATPFAAMRPTMTREELKKKREEDDKDTVRWIGIIFIFKTFESICILRKGLHYILHNIDR